MPPSSTQLVMLRLDIFCGRVKGGCSGLGLFCGFFLWRFGPLCCTLYSSVHAPAALPAFVLPLAGHADEFRSCHLDSGFFLQPFLVAFFVHLEGDPFTTFVLRYDLHGVAIGLPTVTRCLQVAGTPSKTKTNLIVQ